MANPSGTNQVLTKTYRSGPNAIGVTQVGGFAVPSTADAFTVELDNGNLDVVYKFRTGGVSGTVISTVTLTYASAQTLTLVSGVLT